MLVFSLATLELPRALHLWMDLAGRAERSLRHRADDLADLFDDLADLVPADDQGWRQRQGVAGDAQHQVVVMERAVERVEATLARRLRSSGEVDAGGEAHSADVDHVGQALQRHYGVGEFRFQSIGAFE